MEVQLVADALDETACNSLLFRSVCSLFQRVQNVSGKDSVKRKCDYIFHREVKLLVTNPKDEDGVPVPGAEEGSLYPLLRVILPAIDNERARYGMKEKNIAKKYVENLNLSTEKGEDGYKLLYWNRGDGGDTKATGYASQRMKGNEFASILENVINSRVDKESRFKLTLGDVNRILDSLVSATQDEAETIVLRDVIGKMGSVEQKWFWRIVLKDLKFGLKHENVLQRFFPKAMDIFNIRGDLRFICTHKFTPEQKNGLDKTVGEIEIFNVLYPMLAKGFMNSGHEQALLCEKAMGGDSFIMDTKLDGERMLLHIKGKDFKFFTRNGSNYTEYYSLLGADIVACLDIQECIIDGEVMAFNKASNKSVAFGKNKTVADSERQQALNGKNWEKLTDWLQFYAFDIIFIKDPKAEGIIARAREKLGLKLNVNKVDPNSVLKSNGEIITLPLGIRREILHAIMPKHMAMRFNIVEHQVCFATDEAERIETINTCFLQSWQDGEEGLVVKQFNSFYLCGEGSRDQKKWVKMKPAYADLSEPLDLVVLGAYQGKGLKFRGEGISTFLMGTKGLDSGRYETITKVGTGYSFDELELLREELRPLMKPFDKDNPPSHLSHWKIMKNDDIPDFYVCEDLIAPRAPLFEIKFDQVISSDTMSAGIGLRFPRVKAIRRDKSETAALEEIIEIMEKQNSKGKKSTSNNNNNNNNNDDMNINVNDNGGDEDGEHFGGDNEEDIDEIVQGGGARGEKAIEGGSGGRKRQKTASKDKPIINKVAAAHRYVAASNTELLSNIFADLKFCVYGDELLFLDPDQNQKIVYKKDFILKLIQAHNGSIITNPIDGCIVVALPLPYAKAIDYSNAKATWNETIKNVIKQGKHDVYLGDYILDSIQEDKLIEPTSSSPYFLYCRDIRRSEFEEDAFGVSVVGNNTDESLRSVYSNFDLSLAAVKSAEINIKKEGKTNDTKAMKAALEARIKDAKSFVSEIDEIDKKSKKDGWRELDKELCTSDSPIGLVSPSNGNLFWDPNIVYCIVGDAVGFAGKALSGVVAALGGKVVALDKVVKLDRGGGAVIVTYEREQQYRRYIDSLSHSNSDSNSNSISSSGGGGNGGIRNEDNSTLSAEIEHLRNFLIGNGLASTRLILRESFVHDSFEQGAAIKGDNDLSKYIMRI